MPPAVWRVPIYLAGWLVPARERAEWRRRWTANLDSCRVLVERGELPADSARELLSHACRDASRMRHDPSAAREDQIGGAQRLIGSGRLSCRLPR